MKRGRIIATIIFVTWFGAVFVYSAIRPRLVLPRQLHDAILAGNLADVRAVLAKGPALNAPLDDKGHTALWFAAYAGQTEIVRALLERGAQVDPRGSDGWTPLMWAAYNGHADTVRELIAHGADVDAKGKFGETALRYAADGHHADVVALLEKAGAGKR